MNKLVYEAPVIEEQEIALLQVIAASTQEQGGSLGTMPGEDW